MTRQHLNELEALEVARHFRAHESTPLLNDQLRTQMIAADQEVQAKLAQLSVSRNKKTTDT